MIDSDDKINEDISASSDDKEERAAERKAPAADRAESSARDGAGGCTGIAGELVKLSVKAAAVTLSVVILILSILTVTLPLQAMRVFNSLGMSERALNSGGTYIERRLKAHDALAADELGNFTAIAAEASLTDDDMVEALTVCMTLSDSLMRRTEEDGDKRSARYFAEKLELFTRRYASLNAVRTVNAKKDAVNIVSVPSVSMQPLVYDFAHTVMVLNYRARIIMGGDALNYMLYDSGRDGDCVQTLSNRSNTFAGVVNKTDPDIIDGFIDYIDLLDEYLGYAYNKLGVTDRLNEAIFSATEPEEARDKAYRYRHMLKGDEFRLFITPEAGFTPLYENLKSFRDFAQAAVDYNCKDINDTLHRLYWLNVLNSVSTRLWYMSMMLYYDQTDSYGNRDAVLDEYGTCELYKFVNYKGRLVELEYVYTEALKEYRAQLQ